MNELLAQLAALPRGEAIFDMDGTLIEGDLGEAALKAVDRMGHRNRVTEGHASLWDHYVGLGDYVAQCRYAVEALGGLTLGQVAELADGAYARGEVTPRPAVCELAHAVARHHRVWLLTGSAEVLGLETAKRLGLDRVRGIRVVVTGDRLGDTVIGPVTGGVGKVAAMWEYLGRRPVFAIGDSPHDVHLLREAKVARATGARGIDGFATYG